MKNFMKKAAAAMIAMLAVVAVFGTSVPAQAASKAPKSLSVKVTTKTVDIKGKSTISVKSVKPANASKAVTYKSSNKKIVTVNKNGVIKAGKKTGKAKITVTLASGKKATLKVKVQKAKVTTTKITGLKSKVTIKKGEKLALKANLKPLTTQNKVTYKSSNKKVATVSKTGVVKAKGKGSCYIYVRAKRYSKNYCQVRQKDKSNQSNS